ncbi:hypothetical protein HNR23_000141 [Nocardiopsis mwathae]|uniref:CDP-alcohol phosphatidyltransferase family protein n=1 Tax=Nocardiopsis mwathae TaxID=1472723 RepID=A0A7W9YF19_9ACTN|nr:hypothetical protein [Nocardiopsis mwathae]MBB6170081.1 hypothetical protein [Nocardiopsis mwathae]
MANAAALTDHWLGRLTRPGARWARRARLTPAWMGKIGLILTVPAAVWFTEPGMRGAVIGSLFLAAALFTDAVADELTGQRRDALDTWSAAMLSRLRECVVYAGLALGGAWAGVPNAWAWAGGALIALALRDAVVAAHRAEPGPAPRGVPAPRRGADSPIAAVDPGAGADERTPSDPALTAKLFGSPPWGDAGGAVPHAGTVAGPTGPPEPECGRVGSAGATERTEGGQPSREDALYPIAARWLLGFPQAARFATIAMTITIWDPRVTFIALIVGCGVAVTAELVDQPVRAEAGSAG